MSKYWVWLSNISGLGHIKIKQLLSDYQTAENIYNLTPQQIDGIATINDKVKLSLKNKSLDYAEAIIEDCLNKGIDIIPITSDKYPKKLAYIFDPPIILYKRGKDFDYDNLASLAIVGTRKATPYGISTAESFAHDLSLNGITVISGMAEGVDSAAHKGAIKAGCPTIAVLGTGVDICYPKFNQELYEYIISYGAVLSEYPPGTIGHPAHFPARNRIISGITEATLVVEADLKSGSLITADMANDQGKDVFAIPNNINAPKARGTNQLIKEFAYMVTCVSDILDHYVSKYPEQLFKKPELKISNDEYVKNVNGLSEDEKILIQCLGEKPVYIDEILRKTKFPVGKVNGMLTLLQMKDIIHLLPGNSYILK